MRGSSMNLHSVKDIAICAGGLGFDFLPGSPPLRRFCGAVLPGAKPQEWARYSLNVIFGVISRV